MPFGDEIDNFPVMPSDDIIDIYGIIYEDFDDALVEMARQYKKISLYEEDQMLDEILEILGDEKIITIEDLIFVLWELANRPLIS